MTLATAPIFATARVLPEPVTVRPLVDDDFDGLRMLLVDTLRITPPGFNWEVRRLDGKRYHNPTARLAERFTHGSAVWTTASGRIVAAVHPEGSGDAWFPIHPDFRALEPQLIEHAIAYLPRGTPATLDVVVMPYDVVRQNNLAAAGFRPTERTGAFRRMRVGRAPIPSVPIHSDYVLRTTRQGDPGDCRRIAELLNAAFGRDFHSGGEIEIFHARAPSFRADLDLVAEAADGSFAAYVGIAYDGANGQAIYEPVCTHPDHRRHGLAACLMCEGLRRLQARGATDVVVGTGDAIAANRLYESIGFTETYVERIWRWEAPSAG